MAEIIDHVAYLSNEIGPRPAGTEEEQQAALYLTEQMQKETGLSAHMEDFESALSPDLPRAICCGLSLVATVLAFLFPVLWPAAIAACLVVGVLFLLEELDRPILSRILGKGVSQNVVARYEPGYSEQAGGTRRRKVILVSRYDSGKIRPELKEPFIPVLIVVQRATLVSMALLPVLAVLRFAAVGGEGGVFQTTVMALMVIACLFCLVVVALTVVHRASHYNDAANCNAAGVAVMLEVAKRVGTGRIPEAEIAAQQAQVHGAEAAYEEGVVPDGAVLSYEVQPTADVAEEGAFGRVHAGSSHTAHPNSAVVAAAGRQASPNGSAPQAAAAGAQAASGLAAAKAAIAALTGQPVEGAASVFSEVVEPSPASAAPVAPANQASPAFPAADGSFVAAQESVEADAEAMVDFEADEAYLQNAQPAPAPAVPASTPNAGPAVPDWYAKAQQKAKKPQSPAKPVQRSRYADALDAAVVESNTHFAEANLIVEQRLEESLQAGREDIREVKAPQWSIPSPGEPAPAPASQETSKASQSPVPFDLPDPSALPSDDQIAIPSWLDAVAGAKEEAHAADRDRTANRVDVTQAPLDASGRIDVSLVPNAPYPAPQPVTLPSVGVSAANLAPITELPKQRAPLAEAGTVSAAKSLLSLLPSITLDELSAEQGENASPSAAGSVADALRGVPSLGKTGSVGIPLRSAMASLSGAIPTVGAAPSTTSSFALVAAALVSEALAQEASSAQQAVPAAASPFPGAPAAARPQAPVADGPSLPGATVSFDPVGEDFSDEMSQQMIVADADDSDYVPSQMGMGAFGGPGYVDMPKSRMQRFLGKFRHSRDHDELEEVSAQQWLNVDESFDARTVGAQRGSWDSFRTNDDQQPQAGPSGSFPQSRPFPTDGETASPQVGGREETGRSLRFKKGRRSRDEFGIDGFDDDWSGGAFTPRRMENGDLDSRDIAEEAANAAAQRGEISEELRQIYQFRNPDLNIEVWFVALGSELSGNSGMRAFMAEHQQDLRGSVIIELSALGAGELSVVSQEGRLKSVKTPSRMARYIRKAGQATGLQVGSTKMLWHESAASFAAKHGCQAMHLCGAAGQKPAYFAEADDVLDNIDEELLAENASFVMELLKNI